MNASLGDHHFSEGSYIQAAQCYAQSSKSFEEVALAFGDASERDALRYYLVCKLERLSKNVRFLVSCCGSSILTYIALPFVSLRM